ncbi:phosphoglycerate mutase-like protein [Piedraia hortae CBS 480.64]|uniref:3-phytase n=1 Tax=Piedraia hortae CBS 480.64 TaxID=1314780 RepID=A0A6A7C5V0_9PEZI|nr:phosphoglycerate mutase-like protein [Piedraia hortae CBS 480.64]
MTSLRPRDPYNPTELAELYPNQLQLQQVQVLLRHGERTPVSARFQAAGLPSDWPCCEAAKRMRSTVLSTDKSWDTLHWGRQIETFGPGDKPVACKGPSGETESICLPGELTDLGRATTLALGQRIRHLYVDQLGFLPDSLDSASAIRLRATPIQRALESVQQAFIGLYPPAKRLPGVDPPTVVTRTHPQETLFPNEANCKRFGQLAAGYAERAATIWNDSPELAYVNKRIGKWMPKESPVAKVDSHPRLSGIMDSINASRAHGAPTLLPREFYDDQLLANVDKICVDEWFAGYAESTEYRKLGIGSMVGDLAQRMVERALDQPSFKMSLAGCHDTTLAATLASLGGFDPKRDSWPKFTSSIAFELFRHQDARPRPKSWFSVFSSELDTRRPVSDMSAAERQRLDGHYVRLRYNDRPVILPHCARPENHFANDPAICTLTAFKQIVDSFTPADWSAECRSSLGQPTLKGEVEHPLGVA